MLSFLLSFSPHISHHLHCQHLMTSVMNYLNALGKQLGRQEGRKCVHFCMCVCVGCQTDLAEGHEQVTDCSHNPTCDVSFAHVSTGVLCIHVCVFYA